MKFSLPALLIILISLSCNKTKDQTSYQLSYGNSIFYIKNNQEYFIYPIQTRDGTYEAFPDAGIDLDENSGAIRVKGDDNNIFTGLKYRIIHKDPNGDTSSTVIMISGITYNDKFYNLSQNDSIAMPIYNGNALSNLPLAGSVFDDNNLANSQGCSVKTTNGQINLAESVRNGLFGSIPQNDTRKDIKIDYKLNDESNKAQNKIEVRLYYYNTMNDVAPDLLDTLNSRQSQGVFLQMNNSLPINFTTSARTTRTTFARPRPPCIIIIGQ